MPQARTKHFSSGQLVTQQSTSSVRIAEQHLSPRTVCRLSSASRLSSIAASFEPTGSRCSPAPDGLAILPETGDFSPFQFACVTQGAGRGTGMFQCTRTGGYSGEMPETGY